MAASSWTSQTIHFSGIGGASASPAFKQFLGAFMRYDVHFCSALAMDQAEMSPGDEITTLSEFDRFYGYVGTFDVVDLGALFRTLQNGGGGLGDKTMQRYVLRRVQHTSLSAGDIAIERDTGRIWFLSLRDWEQIALA